MSDDLWESASDDGGISRAAALGAAEAAMGGVMPFLLAAKSEPEFEHRAAMAAEPIWAIAAASGLDAAELLEGARRQFRLLREALMEDVDPMISLEPLLNGGSYGQGPEKPDEHDQGPDFSHGYSEVPMGAPGGPNPQVTSVRPPSAGPVQEATGRMRRHAEMSSDIPMPMSYTQPLPPDTGTGPGSVDTGVGSPQDGGTAPSLPVGRMASRDPVRRQVTAVARVIAGANPALPAAECDRIGRIVVGRYLRTADLDSSVENNEPVGDSSGGGGSSGKGGEGLGGVVQHGLEWQGLKGIMPGIGGGGGAAAGEAAGGGEAALGLAALAL